MSDGSSNKIPTVVDALTRHFDRDFNVNGNVEEVVEDRLPACTSSSLEEKIEEEKNVSNFDRNFVW